MQFNQNPYSFKKALDSVTTGKINQVTQESENEIQKLNEANRKSEYNLNSSRITKGLDYLQFLGSGFVIGLIVGVFVCFTNGDAIDAQINFSSSIGSAFAFWLMFGFIGAGLALAVCLVYDLFRMNVNKSIDSKISSSKKMIELLAAEERKKCEAAISQIKEDANAQYQNYFNDFNTEAQKMSVGFTESAVAVEVINWMTEGFAKTIDSADRRSHIERIDVPFIFKTYRDEIKCNLGTYDFEIKRCAELGTPLEQAALTRAIASAIQLNITMKYPQDSSGTSIVTNITYEYNDAHVEAKIIYTAPNGNYKAIRKW